MNFSIIQFDANGEEVVVDKKIASTEFAVKVDGQLYSPAVTTQVDMENDGELSRTTDQCGNTKTQRTANLGWNISVRGIITANNARRGNLSLALLRDVVGVADTVQVRADVAGSGITELEVSNVVITDSSDLHSVRTEDTDGAEEAYEFQMQLGESESQN